MATRKKTANTRGSRSNARRGKAAAQVMPRLGGTANDIVGLLLVVIAIAMGVALLLPSSAPVTRITGEVLVMLFGAGALLFPVALGIFALTFFIGDDEPLSGRVAFGLTLITLSVLSIVSITYPGAEVASDLVLDHEVLKMRGGYVGGGIAWGLLQTVGREVGLVVLIGTIVAGVVICGFSISDAVSRLKAGVDTAAATIQNANEERRARREERKAQRLARAEAAYDDYDYDYAYDDDVDYVDEPATTYLGSRTSTVLTRGIVAEREERAMGTGDVPTQRRASVLGEAVTTLLQRRPAVEDDVASIVDTPLQEEIPWSRTESEPIAEPEAQEGAIPDFLQKKADKSAGKRRKATKRASRKTSAKKTQDAAPQAVQQKVADANVRVDAKATSRPGDADETYTLPPLSMLSSNPQSASSASSKAEIDQTMAKLQGTLREFGLSSRVVDYISGPLVTTFRIEMGEGERVNKIRNLEDDIALTLAAEKVRIFAPIAGTSYVGIEIPNKTRQNVHLGDVLPYAKGGPLEVAIGRDSAGKPVIADIAKMPHMLVAGTTGSGKSVLINSMIMSLLMRSTPKQVRLIMVDPKRVEFKGYNGIPHLYVPVVTEPRQAASALQWAVSEMERRLKVFERAGARNITVYNTMCTSGKLSEMDNPPEPMPYLVIVIDELSDLMMVAGKDVEASIVRIAQLARAAGIHLVIATQRPSANVVTGLIKSNIDSRVALKVSSGIDSRVILDETGADRLLGNGDMLFKDRGLAPKRVLGCYASDPEIESVVDFIRGQGEPDYHEEILSAVVPGQPGGGGSAVDDEDDPLIWEAAQIVVESQLGSTSGLQRRLKVGYARAGRIMDMLESKGVVGPASGSKPREVLLDEEGLEDLRVQEEKYREV
ncbi:MAG: DNA translocase FtsK [Atopobiaceae bacterium]|nr:DNA translocase FtsK [Atopobiaceae bacterium]